MDFVTVVKTRKSVRKFQKKQVEDEKIQKILELVNLAPSAGNLQSYKIYIIKDKKRIGLIENSAAGMQGNLDTHPSLILVFCANLDESSMRYSNRGRNLYAIQDATIACAYAQLAVNNFGLASYWVGSFAEDEIKKIIKTDLLPVALLPIGYGAEKPPRRPRKSLSQISEVI